MDMLETRIGPPNTVYGSVSLSVKDVPAADRDVDLFYSGRRILWRKSLPPSAQGKGPLIFDATSGLTQIAKFQTTKDSGPIPEGTYTFLAQIDSKQSSVAQANALGDDASRMFVTGFSICRWAVSDLPSRNGGRTACGCPVPVRARRRTATASICTTRTKGTRTAAWKSATARRARLSSIT